MKKRKKDLNESQPQSKSMSETKLFQVYRLLWLGLIHSTAQIQTSHLTYFCQTLLLMEILQSFNLFQSSLLLPLKEKHETDKTEFYKIK